MKTVWELISATFNEWLEDKAQRLGAALAYYTVFSLAPLLVIVVYIADSIYSRDSLIHIHSQIAQLLGSNAADGLIAAMRGLQHTQHGGLATLISVITLLLGATAAFGSLQDAMNTIWEVAPKSRPILTDLLRTRLLSFLMVLCFCLLVIVALIASTILSATTSYIEVRWPGTQLLWRAADFLFSFGVTTLLFAAIYRILPDVRLAWSDVWIGAAATAVLFTLGRFPISWYLVHGAASSVYGAAGSIMVLLTWIYYTAQILFLGAEFTQVYANRFGSKIRASRGAVRLTEAMRIQEGIPSARTIAEARKNAQRKTGS